MESVISKDRPFNTVDVMTALVAIASWNSIPPQQVLLQRSDGHESLVVLFAAAAISLSRRARRSVNPFRDPRGDLPPSF